MNETNLNAELLSAESRGRKHIPLAVFAVIVIHIALFLVLLIAAGCRARARARQNAPVTEMAAQQLPQAGQLVQEAAGGSETAAPPAQMAAASPISQKAEQVIASEPVIEKERVSAPGPQRTAQRALPSRPRADAEPAAGSIARTYVVQPGDTIGKIAKDHGVTVQSIKADNKLKKDVIYPGQKLRVNARKPARQMASI